ncbi:MAG: ribosomal protein S18-alanine N-acetyltransferase [Caldilineaceae bacterium]|nr:ribosomal protein S18-alanine N-acetyltransferase [Caldilineaceae bacterium]HRJ41158.1 ribosomal protein S18-alanine N-acetyltransferase [Caldilineaceae bacterium]
MSLPPLQIRPMTADDLDGVLLLEATSFASDAWSRELYQHELNDNRLSRYRVVVSADSDKVIAQGGWMLFGEEAHILTIAVRPEFRGQGIGRWLLLHLLAEARAEGCVTIVLEVRPSNEAALRLYERMGFAMISRRKRYYPDKEDALVLLLEGIDEPLLWGPLERELERLAGEMNRQ